MRRPTPRQLRLARTIRGISQDQLALRVGCTQATLSHYELGKGRLGKDKLARIAKVLGLPRPTDDDAAE